ncbi:MAG: ATP synthase subunit I [Colwellia sp.]
MKNKLTQQGRKFALQQNIFMFVVLLICTLFIYLFWGMLAARSAFSGGIIAVLPNILFAYKAFKFAGAKATKKVVESFFSGIKLKMALTALLLAFALKFLIVLPMPFFAMFSLVLLLPAVTPFLFKN